jgi:light-regulated signal transduction histidine kinase (bacteriophytochrome)
MPEEYERQECFVPLHADSLHDLTSPVHQIGTMFDLYLQRRQKQPACEDEVVLNLIRDSTVRLRSLIDALRDYHRVAGTSSPARCCDSNALLTVALTSLEGKIRESGAEVVRGDLPQIHCDPNQMIYVFTSLIQNALKFRGDASPQIRISAVSQGTDWRFSVCDNGIGIDPRHRESVFHMFKRLHSDRYPGAGAGLAIAHRIVQLHGGRIWVESEPGQGSTFLFTLPCESWQPACLTVNVPR